jgi:hypothetical protein
MISEYYTYHRLRVDAVNAPMMKEDGSFDYFLETRSVFDIAGFADTEYKNGVLYFYNTDEEIRTTETRLVHLNAIEKLKAAIKEAELLEGGSAD